MLEKYCVYVQQYMKTFIVLLADTGLQHRHTVLNQLVCSIAVNNTLLCCCFFLHQLACAIGKTINFLTTGSNRTEINFDKQVSQISRILLSVAFGRVEIVVE